MKTGIAGLVRGNFSGTYADGNDDQQFTMNPRGDLIAAQGLPERSELVRMGNSWGAAIPTASAFTFVAAWPTTRAELVLYNGEDKGGKIYLIDRCWLINITSQAAAQAATLLGQVAPSALAIAAAADNAAVLRHSLSGKLSNYSGRATLALANTAFALANHWFILGQSAVSPMTTNLGNALEANVYGKYIVPPGAAFCLAGLAGTAAGTAIIGVEWHEVMMLSQ